MCTAGPLAALMCSDTMSDRVDDEEARTAKLIVSERRKERRRSADAPASDARGGNDITGRDRAWVNYEATGAVIESAETTPPPPSPAVPPNDPPQASPSAVTEIHHHYHGVDGSASTVTDGSDSSSGSVYIGGVKHLPHP